MHAGNNNGNLIAQLKGSRRDAREAQNDDCLSSPWTLSSLPV